MIVWTCTNVRMMCVYEWWVRMSKYVCDCVNECVYVSVFEHVNGVCEWMYEWMCAYLHVCMWLYVCVCIWTWMSVWLCRLWVWIVSERERESEIEMYCPSYHSGFHYLGLPSRCVTHPGSEVKCYQGCGQMESLFFRPLISWVTQAGGVLYLLWEEATQILFPGFLNAAEIFFYQKRNQSIICMWDFCSIPATVVTFAVFSTVHL